MEKSKIFFLKLFHDPNIGAEAALLLCFRTTQLVVEHLLSAALF